LFLSREITILDQANGLHISYLKSNGTLVYGKKDTVWHTMTVVSGVHDEDRVKCC